MARIGPNAFRQYIDGQDRLTAREYMAERELIRQAINDVEDKYDVVNDVREEIQNVREYVEQVRTEIDTGKITDDGDWDSQGSNTVNIDDGEWDR